MRFYNKTIPQANFQMRTRDEAIAGDSRYLGESVSSDNVFSGARVIVFALPGVSTPTFTSTYVPLLDQLYESFRAEGIDEVYCLSVNDAFVIN